jgi:hypothetical protein
MLVIINNLYALRIPVAPLKANPPLVIDADALLPSPLTLERLKAIPWRNSLAIEPARGIEHPQFA